MVQEADGLRQSQGQGERAGIREEVKRTWPQDAWKSGQKSLKGREPLCSSPYTSAERGALSELGRRKEAGL